MKSDRIWTTNLIKLLGGLVLFIVLIVFGPDYFTADATTKRMNCKKTERIKSISIHGVLYQKYKNERKLNRLKFVNGEDTLDVDIFINERSHFYDYLQEDDSIAKDKGSLEFKIRRTGKDTVHLLYYGCN